MSANKNKPPKLKPQRRAKGAGLKPGQTNNPDGRPKGATNKASANTKDIIANFYLSNKDGNPSQLEKILDELRLDKTNDLPLDYKINTSFKYLRFIASLARDEQEVESENKLKNALYEKFFGVKKEN